MLLPHRLALQYIRASINPSGRFIQPETTHLAGPEVALKSLRFCLHPSRTDAPVVVALNGFAARGFRDPRMQRAASNLACLGFDVYMPILDAVESLRLHPAAIEEIAAFIGALSAHTGRPVGVFSASISASLSLVACTRPNLRGNISGIMAIGPYGNLKRAVSHVMENSHDNYGRCVLWLNFAERVVGPQVGLRRLFRTAIDDDGWKRQHPHLPALLANADPQTRSLYRRFMHDKTYRDMRWQQVCQQLQAEQHWLWQMNPIDHVQHLEAPLFILHGRHDDVILPRESEELFTLLAQHDRPGRLLISPLISHADLAYSWKTPLHGVQLIRLFSDFFKSLLDAGGQWHPISSASRNRTIYSAKADQSATEQPSSLVPRSGFSVAGK